ncbi:MAG: hypothetical protein LBU72_02130 [Burkholderiaceae bacterium]|jgi:hypothetical protein|nr:hypothetical protein [Burkholderiaceae bacterium]
MTLTPETTAQLIQALLHTLGRRSKQNGLLEVLRACELDSAELLRQGPLRPYPVVWSEQGLTVQMQHIKPEAESQDHTWGLHSITLEAERWPGPWPKNFNPKTVTPDELVNLLAQDKAQALCTPEMACMTVAGTEQRTWAALALFDPADGKLQSLTLARHGGWAAA